MATKIKPVRYAKSFDALLEEQASNYLAENDERLWAEKARVPSVRKHVEAKVGANITPKEFKTLRESACQYWRKLKMRRSSVRALDEKQWSVIRVWSEANEGQLAKIRTIEMAVAIMMDAGIQCNTDILRGSSSFMAVWNRTRPKPSAQ